MKLNYICNIIFEMNILEIHSSEFWHIAMVENELIWNMLTTPITAMAWVASSHNYVLGFLLKVNFVQFIKTQKL